MAEKIIVEKVSFTKAKTLECLNRNKINQNEIDKYKITIGTKYATFEAHGVKYNIDMNAAFGTERELSNFITSRIRRGANAPSIPKA